MTIFLKYIFALSIFCLTCPSFGYVEDFKDANNTLFECKLSDFSKTDYTQAVGAIFLAFENEALCQIKPTKKKKVGLKIYTNSGVGISTPKNLVLAVISELQKRGFKKEDICLVDMSKRKMREAGFLPKYSEVQLGKKENFLGCPVYDIESEEFFDKNWFYDNPLMPRDSQVGVFKDEEFIKEARKSYLPIPLFLTVDFWINLPVITDMQGIGVCAALGNITIWNMSNNERFFSSPANAPIALAEVAAIPELKDTLLLNILSYEKVQFVGGNIFNAAFTSSEKLLYASANPVILDYFALDYINCKRTLMGFKPVPTPPIFDYAKQMQLGTSKPSQTKFKSVKPYAN